MQQKIDLQTKLDFAWHHLCHHLLTFGHVFEKYSGPASTDLTDEEASTGFMLHLHKLAFYYKFTDELVYAVRALKSRDSSGPSASNSTGPYAASSALKNICKVANDVFLRYITQTAVHLETFYCRRHRVKSCHFCLTCVTDTPLVVIQGPSDSGSGTGGERMLIKIKLGSNGLVSASSSFSNLLLEISDLFDKRGMDGSIEAGALDLHIALKKQAFIEGYFCDAIGKDVLLERLFGHNSENVQVKERCTPENYAKFLADKANLKEHIIREVLGYTPEQVGNVAELRQMEEVLGSFISYTLQFAGVHDSGLTLRQVFPRFIDPFKFDEGHNYDSPPPKQVSGRKRAYDRSTRSHDTTADMIVEGSSMPIHDLTNDNDHEIIIESTLKNIDVDSEGFHVADSWSSSAIKAAKHAKVKTSASSLKAEGGSAFAPFSPLESERQDVNGKRREVAAAGDDDVYEVREVIVHCCKSGKVKRTWFETSFGTCGRYHEAVELISANVAPSSFKVDPAPIEARQRESPMFHTQRIATENQEITLTDSSSSSSKPTTISPDAQIDHERRRLVFSKSEDSFVSAHTSLQPLGTGNGADGSTASKTSGALPSAIFTIPAVRFAIDEDGHGATTQAPIEQPSPTSNRCQDISRQHLEDSEDDHDEILVPPPQTTNLNQQQHKLGRVPWKPVEVKALEDGLRMHGKRWADILKSFGHLLHPTRTQIDLKDKARNEKKRLMRQGRDLGVWALAC